MLIDAHIHYTPPSMAENLGEFAEQEPYWGLLISPDPKNHTLQGWATPERMIADMDRAGVDKVMLLGAYRQSLENSITTNNETLDIMHRYPDRVIGFAVVQPEPVGDALDEIKRCVDAGMQGIGELNPYGQGITFEDPKFLRIVEACIEHDLPLNLHVSEEIGHFYLGKSTTPLRHYYQLALRYPELKLILAHWGGGLLFYEIMSEVRQNLTNVWYDTAASPLLYPTQKIFSLALQMIDHKKIMYGSDYPLLICPKKQDAPDFLPFLSEIADIDLPLDVRNDIMGDNAARLLGLQPSENSVGNEKKSVEQKIITEIAGKDRVVIDAYMSVRLVAETWQETQAVFEKNNIVWKEQIVPFWEPIAQSAAAQGLGPKAREQLLDELNESIHTSREGTTV
jgi:uncharacterized protein